MPRPTRTLSLSTLAAALAAGSAARAQQQPQPQPQPQQGAGAVADVPELAPVAVSACPEESRYRRAFDEIAAGRFVTAQQQLREVLRACPSHPYAREMLRLADQGASTASARAAERLDPEEPGAARRGEPGDGEEAPDGARAGRDGSAAAAGERPRVGLTDPERPTTGAQIELVTWQGAMGALHFGTSCVTFVRGGGGFCDARGAAALTLLGGGVGTAVGYGLSLVATRPGQAAAINSGTAWGSYIGFMIGLAATTNAWGAGVGNVLGATYHGGYLVGGGAGVAIALAAPPRVGQVAFMNSVAFWLGVAAFYGTIAARPTYPAQGAIAGIQIASTSVGLLAGALVARVYPTSRFRMFVVDLGALGGGTIGALGGLIATGGRSQSETVIGVAGAVGTIAGFAITLGLTQGMDAEQPSAGRAPRDRDEPGGGVRTSLSPIGPYNTPGATFAATF